MASQNKVLGILPHRMVVKITGHGFENQTGAGHEMLQLISVEIAHREFPLVSVPLTIFLPFQEHGHQVDNIFAPYRR